MGISWSVYDMLQGWKDALLTPFGLILIVGVIVYIVLRVTGRIEGISFRKGKRKESERVNYVLK